METIEEYEVKSPKNPIKIAVIDTDIRSDKLRKHVLYSISGSDEIGSFACLRRYKEFLCLHTVLTAHWPGFFIPSIPPKKVMVSSTQGNLSQDLIQTRRFLLDHFLKQTSKFRFLYYSESFQTFIRGPSDYVKASSDFNSPNYPQISHIYAEYFKQSIEFQFTQEHESQIEDAWQYFKSGLEALEKFEAACKESLESLADLKDEVRNLMIGAKEISCFYAEKYGGSRIVDIARENCRNPYEELLVWTRTDILDLSSMNNAIESRALMLKALKKAEERLEVAVAKLVKLRNGKKSIGQVFSKKSREEFIVDVENEVAKEEEEIRSLRVIISVSTDRMVNKVISEFKAEKSLRFGEAMKDFTEAGVKEYTEFIKEADAFK